MIYKLLIGIGLLSASILLVENMIIPLQGFVFLWSSTTGALTFWSLVVGGILGYGVAGYMHAKDEEYEDNF